MHVGLRSFFCYLCVKLRAKLALYSIHTIDSQLQWAYDAISQSIHIVRMYPYFISSKVTATGSSDKSDQEGSATETEYYLSHGPTIGTEANATLQEARVPVSK